MQEETMKNAAELRLEEAQRLLEEEEKGKTAEEPEEKEEVTEEIEEEETEAVEEEVEEEVEKPKRKEKDPKVDAIVALRKQNQLLSEQLHFVKGQVEALTKTKTATMEIPKQKSRLEEIEEELDAIAEKADSGEISLAEERKLARKLDDERFELKLQERMAKEPKQEARVQQEDSYKAQKTAELLEGKEYLNELEPEDWQLIHRKVLKAVTEDDPLPIGPLGDIELRRRMVELADKLYGPEKAAPKTEVDEEKVKAYAKKQELQSKHPADVRKMGSGGNTETMSLEAIEAKIFGMQKEPLELDAYINSLSPATRKKLGI